MSKGLPYLAEQARIGIRSFALLWYIGLAEITGSLFRAFVARFAGERPTAYERANLRERLAELAHDQWSGWMVYQFGKGRFNGDGTWTMPAWAVERWQRQMTTPYALLSEQEKESDRIEADKMLDVFYPGARSRAMARFKGSGVRRG